MRVLLLSVDASWDPARGSVRARRVGRLSDALAADGNEVSVLVGLADGLPARAALTVATLPPRVGEHDLLARVLQANNAMVAAGARAVREVRPDIVHAHDWSSVWAAAALKEAFGLPVVSTLHRLDAERVARQAAWWLTYASRRTIVPDRILREQIEDAFGLPHGKQEVVGPGRASWTTVVAKTMAVYHRALEEEDHALWPTLRRDAAAFRALWSERPAAVTT